MIDEHIKWPWPPEVAQALARFKQGDLVDRPPFFYARHPTLELFDAGGAAEGDSGVHEIHPDDAPPYGVITSQTCDLDEQGTPTQPWFQVSPVYPLPDEAILNKAYIVELTGALGSRYVADLRIELPVEKTLLVGRDPIAGFATEDEAEEFARLLGVRRARAALSNELVNTAIRLIGKRKANNKRRAQRAWEAIWRLGLQIEEGSRLRPVAVRVHVLSAGEPTAEALSWFADWEDIAREEAERVGITLHSTRHHNATSMDARLADLLITLDA